MIKNTGFSVKLFCWPSDITVCVSTCRCLLEAHQLRPASLPAIPNPFPELCSPAGSPILSPIQTSDNHVRTSPALTHTHIYS